MSIQLIIPAAGVGQRFLDAGYNVHKSLIKVNNKPIIQHVIEMFPGVKDISLIYNKETKVELDEVKIIKIAPHKKGPVFSVSQVFDRIDDNNEVIIAYCDCVSVFSFDEFIVEARKYDGSIPCHIGFHPHMRGTDKYAFCRQQNKELLEIREKESFTDNKFNEYASTGIYYFKTGALVKKYFKELMELDINIRGEYYVSLIYNLLLRDGLKVNIFEVDKVLHLGTPYDVEEYLGWSNYFFNYFNRDYFLHDEKVSIIIPMAGRGDRFRKEGFLVPKPLIKLNCYPMFVRAVDMIPDGNKYFIILKEHSEKYSLDKKIKEYYPNSSTILEIQEVTEGQACTCELAIRNLNPENPILISACDNGVVYNGEEYERLIKDNDVVVWSFRGNQTSRVSPNSYSWLEIDENNYLIKEYSKYYPFLDSPLKHHAIIGTMYFRKAKYFSDALTRNKNFNIKTNNEYYVDDLLNTCLSAGLKVKVFESNSYICWGTPDDLKTYLYWQEFFVNKYQKYDYASSY